MSLDQPISVGDEYANFLLEEWKAAYAIKRKYKFNLLARLKDNETQNDYISILVCIYKELEPKVIGRTELKDYKDKFVEYKPYVNNLEKLLPTITQSREGGDMVENIDCSKIDELDSILRNIIEELCITKFEK